MQAHILEEWRIRDVEQKAERAAGRLHEIDALRSDVDRLERSVREANAEADGLRSRCDELQMRLERLEALVMP